MPTDFFLATKVGRFNIRFNGTAAFLGAKRRFDESSFNSLPTITSLRGDGGVEGVWVGGKLSSIAYCSIHSFA